MAISRTILTDIQGCEAPGKYSDEISPLADCLKDLCTKIELLVPWKKELIKTNLRLYFFYVLYCIHLFIYTRKIISTNMLKNYYKKITYPNIIRYKNQLIYVIAVWEPKKKSKLSPSF